MSVEYFPHGLFFKVTVLKEVNNEDVVKAHRLFRKESRYASRNHPSRTTKLIVRPLSKGYSVFGVSRTKNDAEQAIYDFIDFVDFYIQYRKFSYPVH